MIKKGIILSGGMGTRMSPLTKTVNKQLLQFIQTLIFYPLSILMLSNIKDISIVNKGQLNQYKKILPDGKNLVLKLIILNKLILKVFLIFYIRWKFIGKQNVSLILGDNFFYGQYLSQKLLSCTKLKSGAKVLLHKVSKPELYGVAKVNKRNKITKISEKPKKYISDLAITGLYYFDNKVVKYAKQLKPSKRGELEITDLLNKYKIKNKLYADYIGRGGAWLDTGSIEDFYKTSSFVSAIENRQGFKIACLEEIAYFKNWIGKKHIKNQIKFYGKCEYSKYLDKIITKWEIKKYITEKLYMTVKK